MILYIKIYELYYGFFNYKYIVYAYYGRVININRPSATRVYTYIDIINSI